MNPKEQLPGECPGYVPSAFAPIPCMQVQMRGRADDCVDTALLGAASDCPSVGILAPSMVEMCEALQMGQNVDFASSSDCFRVLFTQNSVILREAIANRRQFFVERSSSRNSTLSSNATSGTGTSGDSSGSQKKPKASPPQVFQCPVCPALLNEKDFDRHILDWIRKVGKPANGFCPGIQDVNHPLFSLFPMMHLEDRLDALVSDIRSLIHPGAYDALSAEGSGRHIVVAQRFAELLRPK